MSYARLLVLAPIGVIVVAYLIALLIAIAKRDIAIMGGAYFFSVWAIIIGYGYVIVIWGTLKIAQRCNWVEVAEPNQTTNFST
jgi:FtsH-binding integral membrane protein